MQVGNFKFSETSLPQLRIRWWDLQSKSPMEQDVQLIHQSFKEWIVQSPVPIVEQTQVHLNGTFHTGNGIVSSYFREALGFVLTIAMTAEECFALPSHEFDPGALQVDSFLTEEEEAKILDSLKNDVPYSLTVQRMSLSRIIGTARAILHHMVRLQRKALCLFLPAASL